MFYPMFAMVLLTFIVGFIAVKARFASVRRGEVNPKYFKLMQGFDASEVVVKTTRSFNNMFEIPVLFYVVCTLYISLGIKSTPALVLAYSFVFSRCIHAYIHLTYNHIIHRMSAFWAGCLCVLSLWVILLVRQL